MLPIVLAAALVALAVLLALLWQERRGLLIRMTPEPPPREPAERLPALAGRQRQGLAVRAGRRGPEREPRAAIAVEELERVRLEEWRRAQLAACGIDPVAAEAAARAGVDVGRFRELVRQGCPAETALRIVL